MTTPVDPSDPLIRTRSTDTELEREAAKEIRRSSRRRLVVLSIVASSIVALTLSWFNDIDQRGRSVKNCQLVQDDRRQRADDLDRQSDGVLGDNSVKDGDPNEHIKPFKLEGTPFEEFKPLILAQAKQERRSSRGYSSRIENCDKVHPFPNPIPFM